MKIWRINKEAVISPETAKSLKLNVQLPDDEVFMRAVENTKGAQITDDGLEIDVFRNQHPDQGERDSIRSGIFYQPDGSINKFPYSGKDGYGGIEKIRGRTLLRRPIFVKGATGGKAPQMAYDLIICKGAFESMRGEIFDKVLGWGASKKDPYAIYNLLKKYGGDTEVFQEIERIGRVIKGNGLVLSIQENIVANVVRNAGYDSVIGWSAKRDGTPFISEIFDVREMTYPSKFKPEGKIHESLLQKVI